MRTFRSFLKFEFKRTLTWQNGLLLSLFLALSMYLTNTGINQYQDILTSQKEFQDIEREKAKQWNNYDQYGGYGIYIYFIPSPLTIFFHNTNLFTELIAHVDVGERSNIHNSFKGKKIFSQKPGRFWDFAGIVLLFGSFMALYFGYDSLRDKEYLKFLSTLLGGYQRVFRYLLLSRIILLCSFIFIATIGAVLLLWIRGIKLSVTEFIFLLIFFLLMLLLTVVFFSLGTICGSAKSGRKARFFVVVIWIAVVFFIPAAINEIVESSADTITSNYKSELEKVRTFMDFEKGVKEKVEKLVKKLAGEGKPYQDINKTVWKLMGELSEDYLKNEFQDIQKLEIDLENDIRARFKFFQAISVIFPSSFYLSINNEISSRGYENIIRFHQYAKEIKDRFMRFYVKEKYSKPGLPVKVKSFVQKDENIYTGESRVPWNSWLGFFVTLLWIGCLFKWSYHLYQKSIFRVSETPIQGLSDLDIDIEEGKSNVVLSHGDKRETIKQHLYNVLAGHNKKFNGKVLWNEKNIVTEYRELDFIYLCHPDELPQDIKVKDFIFFIGEALNISKKELENLSVELEFNKIGKKTFNDLKDDYSKRGKILWAAAGLKAKEVYLINNFLKGMSANFIDDFVKQSKTLKERGASIVYLTNDVFIGRKIGDYISFLKDDADLMSITL
jgi:ABC-type Na+ transport system ATPase subunit NatA